MTRAPDALGDLDAGGAHSRGRPQNEHVLPGAKSPARDEHPPRGDEHERHGGGVDERELSGYGDRRSPRGRRDSLAAGASDLLPEDLEGPAHRGVVATQHFAPRRRRASGERAPVPEDTPDHAVADRGDDSRRVAPGDVGQAHPREAPSDEEIEMVQRRGLDVDQHLDPAGNGILEIAVVAEHRDRRVFEEDRFHS